MKPPCPGSEMLDVKKPGPSRIPEGERDGTVASQTLLQGRVQGLGVRPAISRLAIRLQLRGFVANTSQGVLVHLEGSFSAIEGFQSLLTDYLPQLADCRISRSHTAHVVGYPSFEIHHGSDNGPPAAEVPADLAICAECRYELSDVTNRRFGYAFSSCTRCGPRYSIIRSMPYERSATAMAPFVFCPCCDDEFQHIEDRRFHGETVACANCGPQVWFESAAASGWRTGMEAIVAAADLVRIGGILAVKGLGGYQLICDAAHEDAVRKLRDRKQRRFKPLAVMIPSCEFIHRPLSDDEVSLLNSPANPIVILEEPAIPLLAPAVNPHMNSAGVFLPTTPLHQLLLNELHRPLVVTSGNRNAEPLVFDDAVARESLSGMADGWLLHDRTIERPVDDSVVRLIAARAVTIRAARGMAPLRLPIETASLILAVGGDQKTACAVSNGRQVILGPYVGDMKSLAARQRFVEQVDALKQLYRVNPDVIVHDLHPDYFTTQWAADQGRRTLGIQHHHAHIVSGMLEHGLLDQRVLGVAFDGTGYGPDGTIWGGEFLLASKTHYRRVASLMPFVLPGGDVAIREPWRVAVSLLAVAMPELTAERIAELLTRQAIAENTQSSGTQNFSEIDAVPISDQIRRVQHMVSSGIGPVTSSMGRLFDGVAAFVLGIASSGFEGEPAMRLEAASGRTVERTTDSRSEFGDTADANEAAFRLTTDNSEISIDWKPVIRKIVHDIAAGVAGHQIAAQFHENVAAMIGMVANHFPGYPVVFSGGCFQNRLLTESAVSRLRQESRIVAPPGMIPPNDGGLAAGQIAIAAARIDAEECQRSSSCV